MGILRILRLKRKLTQQKVADRIGISKQGYSFYELEKKPLPPEILKSFVQLYGVSAEYILAHIATPPQEDEKFLRLLFALDAGREEKILRKMQEIVQKRDSVTQVPSDPPPE